MDDWQKIQSAAPPGADAAFEKLLAHVADIGGDPDKRAACVHRAADKLMRARIRLGMRACTYAHSYILAGCRESWDWGIPTACCDGATIRWNPAFVDFLSVAQVAYVLLHEGEHLLGLHVYRAGAGVDHSLANKAMDVTINGRLSEWAKAGLAGTIENPPFGLWHPEKAFWDRAWEQVYADLRQQQPPGGKGGRGKAGSGSIAGLGDVEGPGEDAPGLPDAQANVIAAVQAGKMAGDMPGHLAKIVDELADSGVDWASLVRQYMTERAREHDDSTWCPPDRRLMPSGILMPATTEGVRLGRVLIMVDASGSTWCDEIMSRFRGALQEFMDDCRPEELTVLYWDTQYQGHETFSSGDEIRLEPKGGGGTAFGGVWDWVDSNMPSPPVFAAMLTDLEVSDFGEEPGYPVLWVVYGNPGRQAPFGDTIEATP